MAPNGITAARILGAFVAVALFRFSGTDVRLGLAAVLVTILTIALDGLDGYVARRKGMATALGAQFDILGDRAVENLYFTFFATAGAISVWVPVFFFVRGTLTDFVRSAAARYGHSGFGEESMLEGWWGRAVVASRASRVAYASLKCLCFVVLGVEVSCRHVADSAVVVAWQPALHAWASGIVAATVIFCLLRAAPVLWQGRRFWSAVDKSDTPKARPVSRRPPVPVRVSVPMGAAR
ncbi:MAG: CDP-alcohol phosphatidyltransferase family protein [Candidatus Acidiferrales bacterium]